VGIRIAAIGDMHLKIEFPPDLAESLVGIAERADVLVIAGDITDQGRLPEVELAADVFRNLNLPIVAVLGNHDRRCLRRTAFRRILENAGVTLLDGQSMTMPRLNSGSSVGFAGVGGYGGGFWPNEGPAGPTFRISQAVAIRARREAARLEQAIESLRSDVKVVVMHYSPTATTLGDEPLVKYWMLGNSELAKVIDRHDIDLVIHGHAHLGNTHGHTLGGTPVRNVAVPVTGGPTIIDLPLRLPEPHEQAGWEVIRQKA
jgi:Icc-related predicted phosphoesterase